MNPISEVHHLDCLEYMKTIPDKRFDLAIADPPYGNRSMLKHGGCGKLKNRILNKSRDAMKEWNEPPEKEYFKELFRVSKNQIIFGGNYFELPPSKGVICWDKVQPFENFSQIEYIWTSFDVPAKLFRFDNRTGDKIHPTQKPIAIYNFLLKTFANQGDTIFDSHLGSGSSRIAAFYLGYDFYATEINKTYFAEQEKRFRQECFGEIRLKNNRVLKQLNLEI